MVSRSEAGKRAWAKKSSAEKQKIIARLRGLRGRKKRSGGRTTARKKKSGNGNGKKQGVVSWAINVISLVIGLADVFARTNDAKSAPAGQKLGYFANRMIADYTGLNFTPYTWQYNGWVPQLMARGYGPIAGAYGFKTGMGILQKKIQIKSIIPRLGIKG